MILRSAGAVVAIAIGPTAFAEDTGFPGPYRGEVIRVIDGDTFVAKVEIWPSITSEVAVRIRGLDAPETRRPSCESERLLAEEASSYLHEQLPLGELIELEDIQGDAFQGRVVAHVLRLTEKQRRDLGAQVGKVESKMFKGRPIAISWDPSMPDIDWCKILFSPGK